MHHSDILSNRTQLCCSARATHGQGLVTPQQPGEEHHWYIAKHRNVPGPSKHHPSQYCFQLPPHFLMQVLCSLLTSFGRYFHDMFLIGLCCMLTPNSIWIHKRPVEIFNSHPSANHPLSHISPSYMSMPKLRLFRGRSSFRGAHEQQHFRNNCIEQSTPFS